MSLQTNKQDLKNRYNLPLVIDIVNRMHDSSDKKLAGEKLEKMKLRRGKKKDREDRRWGEEIWGEKPGNKWAEGWGLNVSRAGGICIDPRAGGMGDEWPKG